MKQSPRRREGAALLVGLIMLGLISLVVLSTFTMSNTNARAVGNMQFREEAAAAAQAAIEQVLSSPFTNAPAAEEIQVDLNNDDVVDYTVAFQQPVCVSAKGVPATSSLPSSLSLGSAFVVTTPAYYLTVWDLDATVTDAQVSGASIRMHEGVRVRLNQTQLDTVCPSA